MASDLKEMMKSFIDDKPLDEKVKIAKRDPISGRVEPTGLTLDERVALLQEAQRNYQSGCPFKVGDLVTPRRTAPYRQQGEPHIVIEVARPGEPNRTWSDDPSSHSYGSRNDMRVVAVVESGRKKNASGVRMSYTTLPYWVESFQFEPWDSSKVQSSETKSKDGKADEN